MNNKIAIIMSVYKGDKIDYLRLSIDSLIGQTVQSDIYIYIDGPISSEMESLLIELSNTHSEVFIKKSNINKGLANALNSLIDIICEEDYKYVARMDADDISHPTRLEKQLAFLNKNPNISVLGTGCSEFGASYAVKNKLLPKTHDVLTSFSITRCPFVHPTVMFRSNVFRDGNRYPVDTSLTEDMALWFSLLRQDYKFANLPESLLDFRMHEDTVKRRQGLGKALSEFKIRFYNMRYLNRINIKNIVLISARLFFHILPVFMLKILYKRRT